MGPSESHCKARDEASTEAEDVRLPEGLRRENHHPQNCPSQDHEQVKSERQRSEVMLSVC